MHFESIYTHSFLHVTQQKYHFTSIQQLRKIGSRGDNHIGLVPPIMTSFLFVTYLKNIFPRHWHESSVESINPFSTQHPNFCVGHKITEEQRKELPKEIRERGVDVGVCILLETSDGRILVTRRSPHMRTFPGVWVPPGGHVGE